MATFKSETEAINAVIELGKSEEGYLEKKSPANLDSKTANAGYNNYTKYWRDLAKLGVMGQSSTFSGGPAWYWCAGFLCWIFCKVFGVDLAKKLLLHMPYTSCANMGELAKSHKQLFADPKIGDIVLFWNGSRFSHTGYVYRVTSATFYTIEGNTNSSRSVVANGGAVCLKSYNTEAYKKKGVKFFRPDYSLAVKKKVSTADPSKEKIYLKVDTESGVLRCREKPAANGKILGNFAKGKKLRLLERTSSKWWKVRGTDTNKKSIKGYCSTDYLREI